jgi:pilus assembly protein CpaF
VDARLPDGSRVNAVIPPISLVGPVLTVRKFFKNPITIEQLIQFGSLTPESLQFLKACVESRLNIVISGGTGSGKTTLLNVLSSFIPNEDRIVTIEDAAELQLQQEHIVRLETRPPNIEGRGEVRATELVRNALRMRPERIIIGECRGPETLDMLQAMNTGHDGSLTTIHANSPRDALLRLETLVAMTGLNIPNEAVRRYISSAIHVIIHISRLVDGSRKVVSFQEITGMEGNTVTMQEIFAFEQTGIDESGRVKGRFAMKGFLPKFMDRFAALGVPIPYNIFDSNKAYEI